MNKRSIRISAIIFLTGISVCLFVSSCSLEKRISVTTGTYDNIPNRYAQPNMEIETSRDTVATCRF